MAPAAAGKSLSWSSLSSSCTSSSAAAVKASNCPKLTSSSFFCTPSWAAAGRASNCPKSSFSSFFCTSWSSTAGIASNCPKFSFSCTSTLAGTVKASNFPKLSSTSVFSTFLSTTAWAWRVPNCPKFSTPSFHSTSLTGLTGNASNCLKLSSSLFSSASFLLSVTGRASNCPTLSSSSSFSCMASAWPPKSPKVMTSPSSSAVKGGGGTSLNASNVGKSLFVPMNLLRLAATPSAANSMRLSTALRALTSSNAPS
mmetsp:Transcript_41709/g.88889  ORF Transcript_41709/g.88889 Transcript_41709/m.88889 type:complete len:255 (+) Transcript_41709:1554-2318(+)